MLSFRGGTYVRAWDVFFIGLILNAVKGSLSCVCLCDFTQMPLSMSHFLQACCAATAVFSLSHAWHFQKRPAVIMEDRCLEGRDAQIKKHSVSAEASSLLSLHHSNCTHFCYLNGPYKCLYVLAHCLQKYLHIYVYICIYYITVRHFL